MYPEYMKNIFNSIIKTQPNLKKNVNRHITKKIYEWTNKCKERCSTAYSSRNANILKSQQLQFKKERKKDRLNLSSGYRFNGSIHASLL